MLKVPVGDGTEDFVEVEVSRAELRGLTSAGVVLASESGDRFEVAGFSLAGAVDRVMPGLRVVLARLREGVHAPDELTLSMGLQVGGETGLVFAKGTAGANFAVTMTWRRADES